MRVNDEAAQKGSQDELEIRRLYEQYKLQWLIYHQLGLVELIDCMEAMVQEDLADSSVRTSLKSLFEDWEYGIGFDGGQIWPCFEEYRETEYLTDPGKAYMLISVYERDICTEVFPSMQAARNAMLAELKREFLKENEEALWDSVADLDDYECDCFGFSRTCAWSNLDDDCNCDWRIVPIPPAIV